MLIDIFYDHFLAVHWNSYSSTSLEIFAEETYQLMQQNYELLPEKIQFMLPYITQQNWLLNYQHKQGIERTLQGMARRSKYESGMENGLIHLNEFYEEFEKEFIAFFIELEEFVKNQNEFIVAK